MVLMKSTISVLALLADVDAGRGCRTGRRRCGLRRCGRGGSRRRAARAATSPARASAKRCTVCVLRRRAASLWSNSVTSTALPSTCVSNVCGLLRLNTTRVRLPACTTLRLRSAGSSTARWLLAEAVAGVEKIERDARRAGDGEARRRIGGRRLQREPDDRAAGRALARRSSCSMLFGGLRERRAGEQPARRARQASQPRPAGRAPPHERCVDATRIALIFSLPVSLVGLQQLQRAGPLGPVAGAVLHQFLQLDLAVGDADDDAEVLPEVVAVRAPGRRPCRACAPARTSSCPARSVPTIVERLERDTPRAAPCAA